MLRGEFRSVGHPRSVLYKEGSPQLLQQVGARTAESRGRAQQHQEQGIMGTGPGVAENHRTALLLFTAAQRILTDLRKNQVERKYSTCYQNWFIISFKNYKLL
jgi:hypothetical protein